MKLLVVEDHPLLLENLRQGLVHFGFSVDVAADGDQAVDLFLQGHYDAMVLDILLPGMDGWEVVDFIRNQEKNPLPILLLTALDQVEDRIRGLNLGADDYLVKPFDFGELVARLHALIRRNQGVKTEQIRYGDCELDIPARVCRMGGTEISLTPREFGVLEVFFRNPDTVFSRQQILERVWEEAEAVSSNLVDVYILYLRKKLRPGGYDSWIQTVPRMGYRFVPGRDGS
ncbi:MAG TPA: response regulator transcription factor [Thermotogota bacterium]|nr:response regulator transcription factor [Thermotogota bacterium]HRW92336.1 response regulator transcription factor [Thermotogota bacterium]